LEDRGDKWAYVTEDCTMCIDREADAAICTVSTGNLIESTFWFLEKEYDVQEVECRAQGAKACVWEISKTSKGKSLPHRHNTACPGRLAGPAKMANPGEELFSASLAGSPSRAPKGHTRCRVLRKRQPLGSSLHKFKAQIQTLNHGRNNNLNEL